MPFVGSAKPAAARRRLTAAAAARRTSAPPATFRRAGSAPVREPSAARTKPPKAQAGKRIQAERPGALGVIPNDPARRKSPAPSPTRAKTNPAVLSTWHLRFERRLSPPRAVRRVAGARAELPACRPGVDGVGAAVEGDEGPPRDGPPRAGEDVGREDGRLSRRHDLDEPPEPPVGPLRRAERQRRDLPVRNPEKLGLEGRPLCGRKPKTEPEGAALILGLHLQVRCRSRYPGGDRSSCLHAGPEREPRLRPSAACRDRDQEREGRENGEAADHRFTGSSPCPRRRNQRPPAARPGRRRRGRPGRPAARDA